MEALTAGGAAVEHVQVLSFGVVWASLVGQLEVSLDDIRDIDQNGGRALLTIFFNKNVRRPSRER